jgi:hypothetical protein
MSEFEKFCWVVFIVILIISFIYFVIAGFITNCVFHWPIRWDVGTCWHEQIMPAQQKAAQTAEPFMPQ